jgi:hypothetical protein
MKLVTLGIALCLVHIIAAGQTKTTSVLQKQIAIMFKEDQKWRIESQNLYNSKKSEFDEATVNRKMKETDSLNMIQAKVILKKFGFPGYDLVGEGFSNNFWAIVQHCDGDLNFQQQALLLLGKQVKKKNASPRNYALLQDRVLISTGKKQLYGTQVRYNPQTKTAKPFPTQDSARVDIRRKAVGLEPLNEYLKIFDRN